MITTNEPAAPYAEAMSTRVKETPIKNLPIKNSNALVLAPIHTALPLGAVPGSQRSSAAKATLRTTVDTIASTADKRPPKLGWKPKMYARNAANEALTSKEVMDRKPKPRTKAKPTNRARKNAPTSDSAGPALPIAFNALRKIAKTLLAPTSKVPAPSRLAHPL